MGSFNVSSDPSRWEVFEVGTISPALIAPMSHTVVDKSGEHPRRAAGSKCGACHRRLRRALSVGCERCGVEMHDRCYTRKVMTYAEREALLATDKDVPFICPQCRS